MPANLCRLTLAGLVLVTPLAAGLRIPHASAQASVPQAQVQIVDPPSIAATNQLLSFTASAVLGHGAAVASLGSNLQWSFGDGGSATGPAVTHAYGSEGMYKLRVVLTDSSGGLNQATADVTVTSGTTVAPGGQITFAPPDSPPIIPPGALLPPAIFGPLHLEVGNHSAQPLGISYDLGSAVSPLSQLGLAVPAGYAIQVVDSAFQPPGDGFRGCTPVDGQTNQMICSLAASVMPPGLTAHVAVTASAAGDAQSVQLPPRGMASFVGPEAAEGASGELPAVLIRSSSDHQAEITWDGDTLAIVAPAGYAIALDSVRTLPLQSSAMSLSVMTSCDVPDDQGSALDCSLRAIPPLQLGFHTVFATPSLVPPLSYADDYGGGTLSIANAGADVASGGASIAVTLSQGDAMLHGTGVLRPLGQSSFVLAFSLAETGGEAYLYEGTLNERGDDWTGQGLWMSQSNHDLAGPWSLGGFRPSLIPFFAAYIAAAPPISTGIPPPPPPLPDSYFPAYTGTKLVGNSSIPSAQPAEVAPPTIGQAGQAIALMAGSELRCCQLEGPPNYQWSFGDACSSEVSTTPRVTHTWTQSGVYTIAVVITDETGVGTFALTQIRIAEATSSP